MSKSLVDPFGILKGKGALAPLDPLGLFNKKTSSAASTIDALPVPTPVAPITPGNAQVLSAENAFARGNLLKKSVKDTILAGDTGGFQPGAPGYPGNPASGPASFKGKF